MAEYDSAARLTQRLIAKKGRAGVQLYSVGTGTVPDAAKPWKASGGTAADVLLATFPAVFLSPNEARGEGGQFAFPVYSRGRADLSDSVSSDATHAAYVAASALPNGVIPKIGMLVVSAGVRYTILRNQALVPGEQAVLYILSLKG